MNTRYVALAAWECTELLRSRPIGRLCVIDHGYPLAIPVNYRVSGTGDTLHVIVRTSPSSILGNYVGLASLEVDEITLEEGSAWSVIMRGTLRQEAGQHELPDPEPLVDTDRDRWMKLTMAGISGRRFLVRSSPDGTAVHWQPAST